MEFWKKQVCLVRSKTNIFELFLPEKQIFYPNNIHIYRYIYVCIYIYVDNIYNIYSIYIHTCINRDIIQIYLLGQIFINSTKCLRAYCMPGTV